MSTTLTTALLGTCPVCGGEYDLDGDLLPDHRVAGWAVGRPACTAGAGQPPTATRPAPFFPTEGPHCWLAPAQQLPRGRHPMSTPTRVQRKRTAGWRMPENTVYVGRPGKWGNPFRMLGKGWGHHFGVVSLFRGSLDLRAQGKSHQLGDYPSDEEIRRELAGKNLACWCPIGHPCHADVLLQIAAGKDLR